MVVPPRLRLVAFNDCYELTNLPRVQTFLSKVSPSAVLLAGDFLSPSTLSAIDGGKAMVSTLRAIGVTHASLGNHEADLRLPSLQKRLEKLGKSVKILNANIARDLKNDLPPKESFSFLNNLPMVDIVSSECNRVNVAFTGLISDEPDMFRRGTFRGAPIANILETYSRVFSSVEGKAHALVPLTHQSMDRDRALAQHMLELSGSASGLIIGGHEHVPFNELVESPNRESASVRICKSGSDAQAVNLIDLVFDADEGSPFRLVETNVELVEMSDIPPSVVVSKMVESRSSLLKNLQNEEIVQASSLLPPGIMLSSKRSRFRQTTVGGIFGHCIQQELDVDVALVNGATIKGGADYPTGNLTYAQLQSELPFPTKMVVVPMKRWQLQEAIHYSRTHPKSQDEDQVVERKGYLQTDFSFDLVGFHTGSQDDDLMVALPRNLLKGFCDIQPLMDVGKRLEVAGKFPTDDDFIPAIDLVIRHFCKERWFDIVQHEHFSFRDLDQDAKGFLSRDDIRDMMARAIGHEPADFLVDDMMVCSLWSLWLASHTFLVQKSIDADSNGRIDAGEFSHMLATMEREHSLVRFNY